MVISYNLLCNCVFDIYSFKPYRFDTDNVMYASQRGVATTRKVDGYQRPATYNIYNRIIMVIGFINHNSLLFETSGIVYRYNVRFLSDLILNILVINPTECNVLVQINFVQVLCCFILYIMSTIHIKVLMTRYSIQHTPFDKNTNQQTGNWFYIRICFIYIFYNYLVFFFSYCKY